MAISCFRVNCHNLIAKILEEQTAADRSDPEALDKLQDISNRTQCSIQLCQGLMDQLEDFRASGDLATFSSYDRVLLMMSRVG